MNARTAAKRREVAAALGLTGGVVGVLAGIVQATLGNQLAEWTGHKADSIALGGLTIVLSVISVLSAIALQDGTAAPPARRLVAALGLLVPGSLCFSTAGAIWYLPGALLVTGGVLAVLGGDARETRDVVAAAWPGLLVSLLGAFEILMAVSAGSGITIAVGVIGGVAVMAAPWVPRRVMGLALLLVGTVPFAVLTWWSLASPVLALLALAIGLTALRRDIPGAVRQTSP